MCEETIATEQRPSIDINSESKEPRRANFLFCEDLPTYQRVRERMQGFGLSSSVINSAWGALVRWHGQLCRLGYELPAPAVFSNEREEVEFEWERGSKSLLCVVLNDGCFEFTRLIADDEQTTVLGWEGAEGELEWFLS